MALTVESSAFLLSKVSPDVFSGTYSAGKCAQDRSLTYDLLTDIVVTMAGPGLSEEPNGACLFLNTVGTF